MKIRFYKSGEINGSSCVKILFRSNVILNIEKTDTYCFLWSILATLYPCNNDNPSRVKNYLQFFK